MTTISKGWFISFALAANLAVAGLKFDLAPPTIQAGERTKLTLELDSLSNPDEAPFVFDDLLSSVKGLVVLERHTEKTETGIRWIYELTSYQTGDLKLPPLQVREGANSYSTEALIFRVSPVREPHDEELRENYGAVRNPLPWKKWGRWFVWALLTLFSLPLLVKLLAAIPWRKLASVRLPPPKPRRENPAAWLRKELSLIRKRLEAEGPTPALLDAIDHAVKTYYARRTQLPVPAFTTSEFQQVFSSEAAGKPVAQVLSEFDTYKYRRHKSGLDFINGSLNRLEETLLPCGN